MTLGVGRGAKTWPASRLPAASRIRWAEAKAVPVGLVTGTNGKSTTVRLAAAMAAAAGLMPGCSSSDWVAVGAEILERGDFSGPSGARAVLRDPRVDLAILEIARGGILRRGLPLGHAQAAVITNVAADHLGEYGIGDLHALADAKFVVTRALGARGTLVLNADDPLLVARAAGHDGKLAWFTLEEDGNAFVRAWIAGGGTAAYPEAGAFLLAEAGRAERVLEVAAFPIGRGGAARHNLANALAAILLARSLGLPVPTIAEGLQGFQGDPVSNPGRGNWFEVGGVTVLIDYAHNAHGLDAIGEMVAKMPARRRLVVLGQAGDRDDPSIRALVRAAWAMAPERVIVKELRTMLRGRQAGAVPAVIADELARLGAAPDAVVRAESELDTARHAFAWAQAGDLLMLFTHEDRDEVLALVERLQAAGWRAGEPVPD